ncbi:MAG TPA: potassium-transporting ATPase subunit C [Acidimicrobiia bacterium]|nr:potassium-transporting ATPase subunit C [Acidimicrobiia bacterium]
MRRQLVPALVSMVVFTVLFGVVYPLVVTGVAQVAFKHKADGSIVEQNGKKVGSSLLAQPFTNSKGAPLEQYFQPRPSAANYDPTYSTGSNYGPLNPKLIAECLPVQKTDKFGKPVVDAQGKPVYETNADGSKVCDPNTVPQRAKAYRKFNRLSPTTKIPVDAVTASASGLDPDISVANARLQAPRVAAARGLTTRQVLQLVGEHTDGRPLGIIGEKTVNVLDLNLALDKLRSNR